MPQEMDNYILDVVSCSGFDMLWSRCVISRSIPQMLGL